jgi:hypothetical protein
MMPDNRILPLAARQRTLPAWTFSLALAAR